MNQPLYVKGCIVNPQETPFFGYCILKDGIVSEIGNGEASSHDDCLEIDCGDSYIVPGLIEQHVHGALGAEFLDGNTEANQKIAQFLASQGITAVVPTLITSSTDTIQSSVKAINSSASDPSFPIEIVGVFYEGPFIAKAKRGAHQEEYIQNPDINLASTLCELPLPHLKRVMLIAPELSGSGNLIETLSAKGVILTCGHSAATFQETCKAIDCGVTGATHLWNAMAPYHHRDPGIVGACLKSEAVFCELICDHIHVHPQVAKDTIVRKSPERTCLITDMTGPGGLKEGKCRWNGREVYVSKDQGIRLTDGTNRSLSKRTLAGANLLTSEMFKNIRKMDFTITDFVKMRSHSPARFLGLAPSYGQLIQQGVGNLTVLAKDGEVELTIVKGSIVYQKTSNKTSC